MGSSLQSSCLRKVLPSPTQGAPPLDAGVACWVTWYTLRTPLPQEALQASFSSRVSVVHGTGDGVPGQLGVDGLLSYPHPSPQGSTGYSPQTQQPACPATPAGGWDGMKTNHLCGTPGLAIVTFYSGAGSVGGAFVLEWKLALLPR